MRRFTARLCLVAVLVTLSSAALALSAAEVFAKNRNAIYMLIVSGDEPGVLDVVAQGSAVLIAPGRFVTNCHVLERGKNFVVSRLEERIIEPALLLLLAQVTDLR